MDNIKSIIIEGCDRLGKDTLIKGLKNKLGFFQVLHYQKPELLDFYLSQARRTLNKSDECVDDEVKRTALKLYQTDSFRDMFYVLDSQGRFILNRAHLGESVYSHRYRKYNGSYVFDLEKFLIEEKNLSFHKSTLLVLLHTSSFDFISDDGESFDVTQRDAEQTDFFKAFESSEIVYKLMIDVHDGSGNFVPQEQILQTVITAYKTLTSLQHTTMCVSWSKDESGCLNSNTYMFPDPKKAILNVGIT